ncbi:unnamed protein product [Peniophora sp. CBMAI 1063]|nr:unnamed protein product [Peniophora sp. CBMAI 1063]
MVQAHVLMPRRTHLDSVRATDIAGTAVCLPRVTSRCWICWHLCIPVEGCKIARTASSKIEDGRLTSHL